jgi:hypothetical protein
VILSKLLGRKQGFDIVARLGLLLCPLICVQAHMHYPVVFAEAPLAPPCFLIFLVSANYFRSYAVGRVGQGVETVGARAGKHGVTAVAISNRGKLRFIARYGFRGWLLDFQPVLLSRI